ncbi:MAG: membrane protein insertion efficiency factor YidD [Parachlamydiaceae bacterium]|nr:membrane protein insertion efficiency factor YidD [Parachlamydiaceae bacterium]
MKYSYHFVIVMLVFCISLSADPWGKDADLCSPSLCTPSTKTCTVLGSVGTTMIAFHQNVISPADGPRSHFLPSSSQYTVDAMRTYGFLNGFMLGCDRLMRENSEEWVYRKACNAQGVSMKWNPVR